MPLPLQDLLKKAGIRLAAQLRGDGGREAPEPASGEGAAEPPAPWNLAELRGRLVELSSQCSGGEGGSAALTVAAALVHEAQQRGELCAWIAVQGQGGDPDSASTFYPPDLAGCGIDLAALPVVRVSSGTQASGTLASGTLASGTLASGTLASGTLASGTLASGTLASGTLASGTLASGTLATGTLAARATDVLLRSGALALVVLDLAAQQPSRGARRRPHVPASIQNRLAGLAKKHGTVVLCLTRKDSDAASLGSLVSVRVQAIRQRTAFDRFAWELRVLKDKRRGSGWQHVEVCRGPEGLC